jgi:hypothetical protein
MQHNAPVVFRQVRDFGQIINDTFNFLKQNWRPLGRAIAIICLPAAVIAGFLMGKTLGDMQLWLQDISGGGAVGDPFNSVMANMGLIILGYGLFAIAYFVLVAIVHEYLRAYHLGEHHGITPGELWDRAKGQIGTYFGVTFLSGLLIIIGFMMCFLPGFYPLTVLALVQVCHAMERTSVGGSLTRSNNLVMHQFWPTLGLVIVIYLINWVLNTAITLPFSIAGAMFELNKAGVIGDGEGLPFWYGIFMALQTSVQLMVSMLLYPVVATAMCLKYFTLVEEHEGAGLQERIQGFDQA